MDKRIIMLAALAFAAVACGDDDEGAPPPIQIGSDGAVQPVIDSGVPSIDSSVPDATTANDASTQQPTNTVKGAPGCFSGTPTTSAQFLNACAEGYLEFDNAKRLPGFTGTLPPLN